MNSNAERIREQEYEERQQTVRTVVLRKMKISIGELFLLCILALFIAIAGVKIISNQAQIYSMNKDIQQTKTVVQEQTKVNEDLKVQVKELSEPERLWEKAEKFGLKRNNHNVKVVQK